MRPRIRLVLSLIVASFVLSACAPSIVVRDERIVEQRTAGPMTGPPGSVVAAVDTAAVTAGITAVLMAQQARWNEGDIRGFMDTYVRTRQTTFLSGGTVTQGWSQMFGTYMRSYPDRASMGTLTFSDLTVRPVTNESAIVWGRWRLDREADTPNGLFTLLMEIRPGGTWRIVHDHTSSAD